MDINAFRHDVRSWLQQNCPVGARGPGQIPWGSRSVVLEPDVRRWLDACIERGFTVPTWPREYGGAALTRDEYLVLIDELKRIDARPPLTGRGVNYIGPTLLELGTEDQKQRWLPRCARGDGGWCMGYSEPSAGSDLASLTTRAVLSGDHYVINGRKMWTSDAMEGDYIFALVRTNPDVPRHEGISLIIIDMHQPGVRVSPIRLISGSSPFNETVFDNAIASKHDVVGGVDKGWSAGKRLLQFERSTHAGVNISGTQGRGNEEPLPAVLARYLGRTGDPVHGRLADPALRDRLIAHEQSQLAYRLTQRRTMEELHARAPGFASSAVKLSGALLAKERDELLLNALAFCGLGWEGPEFGAGELAATRTWLRQKSLTIAGGTAEVQLNIIAKRVLGLPD